MMPETQGYIWKFIFHPGGDYNPEREKTYENWQFNLQFSLLLVNNYTGREKKILVPLPVVLSSQIFPFWASMSLRHMERPKAILAFPSLSTTLTPSMNSFSWIFRGIPTPVSRTHTVATLPSSERAPTRLSPRGAVTSTALQRTL